MTKIVFLGDSGTGKTCLIKRMLYDSFDNELPTSVAAMNTMKFEDVLQNMHEIIIWDTAGSEQYQSLAPVFYRGSYLAIIVFSFDNIESYNRIGFWKEQFFSYVSDKEKVIIVGNKSDLSERKVEEFDSNILICDRTIQYIECSAKEGTNADTLKTLITDYVLEIEPRIKKLNPLTQPIVRNDTEQSKCC